ncbi:MAG TPA: dTDP-4-dehydrorhamnose reductase [Nitrospirota bacterium]|nr:dTDP-4-dehydrorhamnose reductase [Nitrospirota bacterium]
MKYLITGRSGQLARSFIRTLEARSIDFNAPEESLLDITDIDIVTNAIDSYKPDVIINCAAYNFVDKAEQARDAAFLVNARGPQNLAMAAARRKAMFVHFGSDYVFDGMKEHGLYIENDFVNPVNEYGKSKLAGEQHVIKELDRHLIMRLSWVFGSGEQNFIHKLLQWSKSNEWLKIACDEFSVPTSTQTVVDVTLHALEKGVTGLYHLTNTGYCSRYEWARFIFSTLGIKKFIRPVTMDTFNLPAQRPRFSAMSNERLSALLNTRIPTWEGAVKDFLKDTEKL